MVNASSLPYVPGTSTGLTFAYFSMEIGLDAAMPTYSGGLGILTADTLRAAADLVESGAAVEEIAAWLYGDRDPREWQLLSEALATLRVSADGRLAWIEVASAAQARAGLGLEGTEDVITYVRAVRGVHIAVAFKEISPAEVRVSFRSRGANDVARVAKQFGGGGHRNAAGCTLHTSLAEARSRVLSAAAASLNANV